MELSFGGLGSQHRTSLQEFRCIADLSQIHCFAHGKVLDFSSSGTVANDCRHKSLCWYWSVWRWSMRFSFADYPSRADQVMVAGRELLHALSAGDGDTDEIVRYLKNATERSQQPTDFRFSAESEGSKNLGSAPENALSAIVFDAESANVLLAAGVALNEHRQGADRALLSQSLDNMELSTASVRADLTGTDLRSVDAAKGVLSKDLPSAKESFRVNAEGVVDDFVGKAAEVVSAVFDQLEKLEPAKVLEGLQDLGRTFQIVGEAGTLIRKGMESLKRAIEGLRNLFGDELFDSVKERITKLWDDFKSGKYTREVLAFLFEVRETKSRIDTALLTKVAPTDAFDSATNQLPALSEKFRRIMKLFRTLVRTIALAGLITAAVHFAAPWIPLVLAGAYGGVLAGTAMVGMNYVGTDKGLLHWVRGVGSVADSIQTSPSNP
jgi:hypothetical protein